jgi:hypothetical protein
VHGRGDGDGEHGGGATRVASGRSRTGGQFGRDEGENRAKAERLLRLIVVLVSPDSGPTA